jgi:hypothetical protein
VSASPTPRPRVFVDDDVVDPAPEPGGKAVEELRQRADDAVAVACDQKDRARRSGDLGQLLVARAVDAGRELGQQPRERFEHVSRRLGDALDPHLSNLESRRSFSTRPPVWHCGQ